MIQKIFLQSHTITGFGGFSKKTAFQFSPNGSTLLLGINGAGKTSILNSLSYSLNIALPGWGGNNFADQGIIPSAVSIDRNEAKVLSCFTIDNDAFCHEIGYNINLIGNPEHQRKRLHEVQHIFQNANLEGTLPVFRYFQSEKNVVNTILQSQSFNKIEKRIIGYSQFHSKNILVQEVTAFLVNQINIENQEKIERQNFNFETPVAKYLRETLNRFTSLLYDEKVFVKVGKSKYSIGQSLVFSKNGNEFEFLQLSSGEKYVFSVVLELIYRTVTLNPEHVDLKDIPGIVLIDEIESHLHPRWQLTIVDALESSFPNFQFIITSHSPMVASSVRRERIIPLNGFEVVSADYIPDVYSGTADELLEKVLESDIQVNTYAEDKKEIEKLINDFDFNKAELKLNELKDRIKSSPQWVEDLYQRISFGRA